MGDEAFCSDDGNRGAEVAGGEAVADGEHITTLEQGESPSRPFFIPVCY